MNSGTLIGSLIFAAVLAVTIGVLINLMMRSWRRRAQQQEEVIGELPAMPDELGAASGTLHGVYVGCTVSPSWNNRITAGDLGYRNTATLTSYPKGILLERSHAHPIWIPREAIAAVRTERGMVGKVAGRDSILAIRWQLPSGVGIDTGFRANDRREYDPWLASRQEGTA